jgi:hypothetical protein
MIDEILPSDLNGVIMEPKARKRVGVIICGRIWLEVDQKIRDWVKKHPNEKIIDRIPIVFTLESGRYCGGLMVETDEESLPSDF